jgi:nucleotide-binding universal stress UspA family protein
MLVHTGGTRLLADTFTHVLVAIDGSPASGEVLRRAGALAASVGAHLSALHVATPVVSSFDTPRAHVRAERDARLEGERLLGEALRAVGGMLLETEVRVGNPAEIICRRAAEIGVDLVVVGSRRPGRIDRLLLGSVSGAVLECAPCSVLVVRARD